MLETKNLCKVYKPRRGVPVHALDGVTLRFPARGMVFLIGKSGSGKSTLLNLLGGLDRYDSGEILFRGVSTKQFSQQDFDTYRNTYVGFIFQEYNVLEEFTVGANIALAIELQGHRADDAQISEILRQVDLEGFGDRRPSELSGGQKQRVAIARALIKNPEIIMADEPTGALDSTTGRAVLDTLKKLSAGKLVIVVSHDREFAEKYADRIIELADGRVISDMEYTNEVAPQEPQTQPIYDGDIVRIPAGYHLTEQDRRDINDYIDRQNRSICLQTPREKERRVAHPTDVSQVESGEGGTLRKIKSRLPLRCALRIGASGLTHKKIRLAFTIFLSCVAFILFGLADTFGAYDHVRTCARSLVDSGISYATVQKQIRIDHSDPPQYTECGTCFFAEDIETLNRETGLQFTGVWMPESGNLWWGNQCGDFSEDTRKLREMGYYSMEATGFSEMTEQSLKRAGMSLLAGRMPDGQKDEIALSSYVCETFLAAGYLPVDRDGNPTDHVITLSSIEDILGKTLWLNGHLYTVTGVFDANIDMARYRSQWELYYGKNLSAAEGLTLYAITQEFFAAVNYSAARVILVGEGFVERHLSESPVMLSVSNYGTLVLSATEGQTSYPGSLVDAEISDLSQVIWAQDHAPSVDEGEIVVTMDLLMDLLGERAESLYFAESPEERNELLRDILSGLTVKSNVSWYDGTQDAGKYRIVGVIDNEFFDFNTETVQNFYRCVFGEELYHRALSLDIGTSYRMAIAPMPQSDSEIRELVSYCYKGGAPVRYVMCNAVTYELDIVHEVLTVLSEIFLYIGIGFSVFASLMLANFISTSISYKKQEIGILRAIGSRGNDVFRIFFAESFLIAMINFVLSSVGVGLVTSAINRAIRQNVGMLITILDFSARQIFLLFVISVAVAAIASFLPVRRIASKRPIDAIRNR